MIETAIGLALILTGILLAPCLATFGAWLKLPRCGGMIQSGVCRRRYGHKGACK